MRRIPLFVAVLLSIHCGPGAPGGNSGRCGDGILSSSETCDDGNDVDEDACTNSCTAAVCGDGVLRADLGAGIVGSEVCDDGNDFDGDGCLANCRVATCGDGILRTDIPEGEENSESLENMYKHFASEAEIRGHLAGTKGRIRAMRRRGYDIDIESVVADKVNTINATTTTTAATITTPDPVPH